MTKIIFTCLFILFGFEGYAQDAVNSNYLMIYEKLISLYDHGNTLVLEPKTSLQTLKRFDFKNPANHQLKPDTLNKAWQSFLNNIDTASFRNGLVDHRLLSQYADKKTVTGKHIYLSPIIFSKDKRKAVCAVRDYGSSLDASEEVFLLEKKGKQWVVFKFYLISIS